MSDGRARADRRPPPAVPLSADDIAALYDRHARAERKCAARARPRRAWRRLDRADSGRNAAGRSAAAPRGSLTAPSIPRVRAGRLRRSRSASRWASLRRVSCSESSARTRGSHPAFDLLGLSAVQAGRLHGQTPQRATVQAAASQVARDLAAGDGQQPRAPLAASIPETTHDLGGPARRSRQRGPGPSRRPTPRRVQNTNTHSASRRMQRGPLGLTQLDHEAAVVSGVGHYPRVTRRADPVADPAVRSANDRAVRADPGRAWVQ